jgi:hypothetical protein
MAQLSNDEIRDIATESGLSPTEVRRSLEGSKALAKRPEQGMVAASLRGKSVAFAEAHLAEAPDQALQRVKSAIERESRSKGHLQGGSEADIVDESRDLAYRIRVEDDGGGGSLVRVDIDPTTADSKNTLGKIAVGVATAAVGTLALLSGSGWLWMAAAVIGGGGFLGLASHHGLRSARVRDAHGLVSQALNQVESRSTAMLPPGEGG